MAKLVDRNIPFTGLDGNYTKYNFNTKIYTTYIFAEFTPTLVPIAPKLSKIGYKITKVVSRKKSSHRIDIKLRS